MEGVVGSIHYMAPEILASEEHDMSCDIWSATILIYILLRGTMPFQGNDEK